MSLVFLLGVGPMAWAAEMGCEALLWDYTPDPRVGLFRVYLCQTSGGYALGTPFYQDPCGYRATEPSHEGRDTEMACQKLRLTGATVYAVVTAVALDSSEESGPSNEIRIGPEVSEPTPPSKPPSTPPSAPPTKPPPLPPVPTLPPPPVVKGPGDWPKPPSGGGGSGISSHCRWSGTCQP